MQENINNIPFSFNRDTSKWIAKLGTSHETSSFADGIVLSNVVVNNTLGVISDALVKIEDGKVYVTLPEGHTLTTDNQTTVTVKNENDEGVKGVSVIIFIIFSFDQRMIAPITQSQKTGMIPPIIN